MGLLARSFGCVSQGTSTVAFRCYAGAGARMVVPQCRWHSAASAESRKPDNASIRLFSQLHSFKAKPSPEMTQMRSQHMEPDEAHVVSLMANQVWSSKQIQERLDNLHSHKPKTFSDHVARGLTFGLYRVFNAMTGFKPENTPVKAVQWRLIVLESVAGVPGFMAAMFRHFRSLRTLKRDHGWIHTLLEEAENERMHLLLCMKMFEAGFVTRLLVVLAQLVMTPVLGTVYLVHPASVHRFVGYLEETACQTYANIIHQVETPGTPLHTEWSQLPAPKLAKTYYKLGDDAMWVDCLKCMFADESNHRDVNHTFATMKCDDPNPFVQKHLKNAVQSRRLEEAGF